MFEEDCIISKLIEEDDKQSSELNITQNEDLGGWKGVTKIEITKKLKSYSNLTPDFNYIKIQRPQKLPTIAHITNNKSPYPAIKDKNTTKKAKLTQKNITIATQKEVNYKIPHNPSEKGQFYKSPSPTTFKALKTSKKKNFSHIPETQNPLNFLYIPETKQINYRKIDSVGYFSPIYEKYFNHSVSNKRIINQLELGRQYCIKNSKSKNEIKDILKQKSSANIKIPKEKSKILKKFLLSPIYLNMCKYNSALNN